MTGTFSIITMTLALACGVQSQIATAPGKLPGHSHAGALLQHDALPYTAMGSRAAKGCQIQVIDTATTDKGDYDPHRPWTELWTVQACGKTSVVTMHFIPDATGTTIDVSPGETKQK